MSAFFKSTKTSLELNDCMSTVFTYLKYICLLLLLLPIGAVSPLSGKIQGISFEEVAFLFTAIFVLSSGEYKPKNLLVTLVMLLTIVTQFVMSHLSSPVNLSNLKASILLSIFLLAYNNKNLNGGGIITEEIKLLFAVIAIIAFAILNLGYLQVEGIRQSLYERSGLYRFSMLAFFFWQAYVIAVLFKSRRPRAMVYLLGATISIISQDRVFLVFFIVAILFKIPSRKEFFKSLFIGILLVLAAIYMLPMFSDELKDRLYGVLDINIIYSEMYGRFIAPLRGVELTAAGVLFGFGADYEFYIPWFEYRGLNAYHFSVDSFFVTFFIKHGLILTLFILTLLLRPLLVLGKGFIAWLVIYLVFHNGLYVPSFLFSMLAINVIFRNDILRSIRT